MQVYGHVQLGNGIIIRWLRFIHNVTDRVAAEIEAVRIVTAQHIHVQRCWVD